eukprot:COSAG06_NODE_1364_length_9696_cov_14.104929_18_plen_154_part_00
MAEALKAAQAAQAKRLSKLTDELQDGALERRPPQPHARRALASTCPLSRAWARCAAALEPAPASLPASRVAPGGVPTLHLGECGGARAQRRAAPRRERDAAHTPTQPSRRCCFGRLIQALSHARATIDLHSRTPPSASQPPRESPSPRRRRRR